MSASENETSSKVDEGTARLLEDVQTPPIDSARKSIDTDKNTQEQPAKKKKRIRRRHFDTEADVEIHAGALSSIIVPVTITIIGVIFVILSIGTGGDSYLSLFMTPSSAPPDGFCIPFGPKATGEPPANPDDENSSKVVIISIIIAAVFVVLIVIITFVILCCYMKGCTKIIYGWLIVATVVLLGVFGGTVLYNLLVRYNVHIDWFTFVFFCLNFAVGGVIAIYITSPLILQQIVLILISIFMAWMLTNLPEWTTWILLVLVACYDLFAVLCPCCALNKLIEIADERNEPIPGLIYSAQMGKGRMEDIRGEGRVIVKTDASNRRGVDGTGEDDDIERVNDGEVNENGKRRGRKTERKGDGEGEGNEEGNVRAEREMDKERLNTNSNITSHSILSSGNDGNALIKESGEMERGSKRTEDEGEEENEEELMEGEEDEKEEDEEEEEVDDDDEEAHQLRRKKRECKKLKQREKEEKAEKMKQQKKEAKKEKKRKEKEKRLESGAEGDEAEGEARMRKAPLASDAQSADSNSHISEDSRSLVSSAVSSVNVADEYEKGEEQATSPLPSSITTFPVDSYSPQDGASSSGSDSSDPNGKQKNKKKESSKKEKPLAEDEVEVSVDGYLGLGLGDFIFYSLLMSRAILTDWTTTFACFFSILFGLSMTVVLLALWRNSLPALPISIFTATAIYFISRYIIHPFARGMSFLGLIL